LNRVVIIGVFLRTKSILVVW